MLSRCGVCCSKDRVAYKKECGGRNELGDEVSWAAHYGRELCSLYECAGGRGHASCGDCPKAPCGVWLATRSP